MKRGAALASLVLLAAARTAEAQCNARPTDVGGYQGFSYADGAEKTFDTASVRVHYATNGTHVPALDSTRGDGVPDTVAYAGEVAEDALAKYAAMGFQKPPSDAVCASNGGDGRLDVYLVRFPNADGSTVTASCSGRTCSSFVLCESTFAGKGYATAKEGFATVVTHELFHAVQNAYDHDMDRFWAEGTAQWAMKSVHPELADFERQLPAFFKEPGRSIDTQPSGVTAGYLYGSSVWPLFLTLAYGDDVVRRTLEAEADGTGSLAAVDAVLAGKNASLAKAFPMFAAWNVATKTYAGTGGYPAAATYPGVAVVDAEDGTKGITTGLSYAAYRIAPEGTVGISLETDAVRNGGVLVPLEGGKARIDRAAFLPANADGPALVVVSGITTKKTDAPYTLRLGAPVAPGAPSSSSGDGGAASSSSSGGESGDGGGCAAAGPRRVSMLPLVALVLIAVRARRRRARA